MSFDENENDFEEENAKEEKFRKETDKGKKIPLKKSYVERALSSYFRNYFSEGFKKLTEKEYALYFYYTIAIIFASITGSVLYALNVPFMTIHVVKILIFICLFSGLGLILGGLIGGISGNAIILNILTFIFVVLAIVFTVLQEVNIFAINYDNLFLQWLKTTYFLLYLIISTFSMFFIFSSLITSLSYKLLTFGNSPNRMFLQRLLRLITWIGLPLFAYLFIMGTLDAQILSVLGIITTILMLIRFYRLPTITKDDNFREKTQKNAIMNYNQVLAFFNLYLLFHLAQSMKTEASMSNLLVSLFLLAFNTFYILNNLTKKVNKIKDEEDLQQAFLFQRQTGFSAELKKVIGEKGLIMGMLGLALGYHAVNLDSYLGSPIALIQFLSDDSNVTPLNIVYHRTFLGLGIILILGTMIAFKFSRSFRNTMVNRYSFRHVMKMFADMFRISDDGNVGVILESYQKKAQDVSDKITKVGKSFKKGMNKFFSLGGDSEMEDEE